MGGAASFKPFNFKFPIFLISVVLVGPWIVAEPDDDAGETSRRSSNIDDGSAGGIAIGNPPPPPPFASGNSSDRGKSSPFKPSTAVIVGVLATMFSLTFLLLLYIKHCNGGNVEISRNPNSRGNPTSDGRKNSGIDRAVVESLPIFRFGSLRGQKDGLDCAVCLTKFEAPEVLRLLPKCKHAFHVECVDTWLDAHSTCPLCRYRVDPEDIVLGEDTKTLRQNQPIPPPPLPQQNDGEESLDIESGRSTPQAEPRNPNLGSGEVSGSHSSVGERDGGFLQIVLQPANDNECEHNTPPTTSFRRSLDSANAAAATSSTKKSDNAGAGCFVRTRKDSTDRDTDRDRDRTCGEHRLEHRIIVSTSPKSHTLHHQRWSEVQPSDLLYLTSEMIISDSSSRQQQRNMRLPLHSSTREGRRAVHQSNRSDGGDGGGSGVISSRSVSEITGLRRFISNNNRNRGRERRRRDDDEEQQQRQRGVVSRWLAWISRSHSQPRANIQ